MNTTDMPRKRKMPDPTAVSSSIPPELNTELQLLLRHMGELGTLTHAAQIVCNDMMQSYSRVLDELSKYATQFDLTMAGRLFFVEDTGNAAQTSEADQEGLGREIPTGTQEGVEGSDALGDNAQLAPSASAGRSLGSGNADALPREAFPDPEIDSGPRR